MNFDVFVLGGYGLYVWPAFLFTLVSCLILYLKTKKELIKHEKIFLNDFRQLHIIEIKNLERKRAIKEALSDNYI